MKSPSNTISLRDRLIVALDFPTQSKALALVSVLSGSVSTYKIGLQLYTAEGPGIIRAIAATGAFSPSMSFAGMVSTPPVAIALMKCAPAAVRLALSSRPRMSVPFTASGMSIVRR